MKKKYFGTDGIRGTAYKFPMNSEFLYNLARAVKSNDKSISKILIGMDTSESCKYIKNRASFFQTSSLTLYKLITTIVNTYSMIK